MDRITEIIDTIAAFTTPAVLGMGTSIFKVARYGWHGFTHFISQSAMCVFVAIIASGFLDMADFPTTVDTAIIGLSGFYGAQVLDIIWDRFSHTLRTAKIPGIECEPLSTVQCNENHKSNSVNNESNNNDSKTQEAQKI